MASALIVVDIQNDFCEGGSLPIAKATEIIPMVNEMRDFPVFNYVVFTRDWHPEDHISFYTNHPGARPYHKWALEEGGAEMILWPIHCVQQSAGADFHPDLIVKSTDIIIDKGMDRDTDGYSGFGTEQNPTRLESELRARGVTKVFVCGLAYDLCVGNTACDASLKGFETYLIEDAARASGDEGKAEMRARLIDSRVQFLLSQNLRRK